MNIDGGRATGGQQQFAHEDLDDPERTVTQMSVVHDLVGGEHSRWMKLVAPDLVEVEDQGTVQASIRGNAVTKWPIQDTRGSSKTIFTMPTVKSVIIGPSAPK
jgi:hypothetical protein